MRKLRGFGGAARLRGPVFYAAMLLGAVALNPGVHGAQIVLTAAAAPTPTPAAGLGNGAGGGTTFLDLAWVSALIGVVGALGGAVLGAGLAAEITERRDFQAAKRTVVFELEQNAGMLRRIGALGGTPFPEKLSRRYFRKGAAVLARDLSDGLWGTVCDAYKLIPELGADWKDAAMADARQRKARVIEAAVAQLQVAQRPQHRWVRFW